MLNATEIFNQWFGNSEENIRKLFAPARLSEEKYGKKSPLYLIVIDEIDALLPIRGESVNKTRDTIVNQFLSEMDGLYELNNVLVVGITNRREEIDSAALRHGRLGEHIKIDLPDKQGRFRIFTIHTKKLVEEKLLDKGVDLNVLVNVTENFSGADIEALVEAAKLFSLERLNNLNCSKEELKGHKDGLVTMEDFKKALKERKRKENEIFELYKSIYI